ncbi:MAG: diguanylate cyclase, partial [Lachnoclostridium sp.]|nr:diguanylate cyclase [Lachnoclostridium sp.]
VVKENSMGGEGEKKQELLAILDALEMNLYLTDMDTHEIIFMNKMMRETYDLDDNGGNLCYKATQIGKDAPCKSCKISELKEREEGAVIHWREYSEKVNKIFEKYDSLVRWNGKPAHMQHSYDVTRFVELQEQATRDPLCQVWNRAAGKNMLQNVIDHMERENHFYSVLLFDVDNVKYVNDNYGHAEGDFLLQHICQHLKERIQIPDFIFRLSGDEFVIVLQDVDAKESRKMIRQWRKSAEGIRQKYAKPYDFSFTYGICQVDHPQSISDIIAQADEFMYEAKLRRRKTRAFQKMEIYAEDRKELPIDVEYQSKMLYGALLQCTDDFVFFSNMKTGIYRYPSALLREVALPGEIIENPLPYWEQIVHPDDWDRFYRKHVEFNENRLDYGSLEFRVRKRSGEYAWMRCRGRLVRDDYGVPTLFVGVMELLGKRNKIDPLTQLMNQNAFFDALESRIQEGIVDQFAIQIVDIDNFHQINELYGRALGDRLLRSMAQTIQDRLTDNIRIFRLEKDQFALIVEHGTTEKMKEIYGQICGYVTEMEEKNRYRLQIQLSAGSAMYPGDSDAAEELYQCAEYALRYAKNQGKGRMEIFNKASLREERKKWQMRRQLRLSMAEDYRGFEIRYQPQVDAMTGKITGVEALMRWKDTLGKEEKPGVFIPILEEFGMIYDAGYWILRKAMQQGKEWIATDPLFSISINVSALQFVEERFLPDLEAIIIEETFPPQNLIIELTESCAVKNINILQGKLDQIRLMGIRIAMDDFGTGYSSLEMLKTAPVDIVKTDRTFIKDIPTSRFDATFISFVIAICHDVGIKVCVEGVEHKEEYEVLRTMVPDYIQGFYFGKPQTAEEITEQLMKNNE